MAGLTYNDVSGGQGLIQDCEGRLNFPPAGISGNTALLQQFTRYINIWYQKIVTMIFASQDDWSWDDSNNTDYPIATTNLVAAQQDYSVPVSLNMLRIQNVNISYDGGATWYKDIPFNKGETNRAIDLTSIKNNFSVVEPFYSIENNAIFVYPLPTQNSTAGLKIWFQRGPLEFISSDTTKAPGIDPAFHSMISVAASFPSSINF